MKHRTGRISRVPSRCTRVYMSVHGRDWHVSLTRKIRPSEPAHQATVMRAVGEMSARRASGSSRSALRQVSAVLRQAQLYGKPCVTPSGCSNIVQRPECRLTYLMTVSDTNTSHHTIERPPRVCRRRGFTRTAMVSASCP